MIINYLPLKRKSLEQTHQRQCFTELAISLALEQDDSLVCIFLSHSDLSNMHSDFGQLLLIPTFIPILDPIIFIIKTSYQVHRNILQHLFDGLIHGYSPPLLKSKSKKMHLQWRTKYPCQAKRENHGKYTSKEMALSISSSTDTLQEEQQTEKECVSSSNK